MVGNNLVGQRDNWGLLKNGERITSIVVKKKDIKWGGILLRHVFGKNPGKDTYGHWWIELGSESYGWWPDRPLSGLIETITGVGGLLNGVGVFSGGTATLDPHHGGSADTEFNPKVDFGGFLGFFQNRKINYGPAKGTFCKCVSESDIVAGIKEFATSYTGGWRYPGSPNCHTFVEGALDGNCLEE